MSAAVARRRGWLIGLGAVAAVALVAGGVVIGGSLGSDAEAAGDGDRLELTIAVSEDLDYHTVIAEVAAEEGLDVTWQNLSDWVLPNTELVAGSVDGNAFQHQLFLATFNAENDADLTPVFSTQFVKWGVFSAEHDSLDEISDGGAIAIPDDPANQGRALLILEAAGLIEIDPAAGLTPGLDDVVDNPRDLTFSAIAARTIPQQFDDPSLEAAVVGTSYFDPSQGITDEDALYLDDDELSEVNLPYVNAVVARQDNQDDPAWDILERAYRDQRVIDAFDAEYFGANALVDVDRQRLLDLVAELEQQQG